MSWNVFTRNWYIAGQHAYVDLRAEDVVVCMQCDQFYNSDCHLTDQGDGIAAWAKLRGGKWKLFCGYGSDFDMDEYTYVKDFPEAEVDGICDWCIRRMLKDGVLVKVEEETGQ